MNSTWYVSAAGSDSNAGTDPSRPLASVSKALALIKSAYRGRNWKAGDSAVIVIRGTITASGSFGANRAMVDISGAGNYPPIILEGDPATGGVLNANRSRSNQGRVLYIANNKVTLSDNLTLSGGYTLWGGGVCVGTYSALPSAGEFVMAGGEISGNIGGVGAGVLIYSGAMSMSGGTITNNTPALYSGVPGMGGGVYVYEHSSFNMSGGAISGNGGTETDKGGGVVVDGFARFTMTGGDIRGNSSTAEGGGVYITAFGEFILNNGVISGNTSGVKGGVFVSSYGGVFTQTGGTVSGNTPN